MYGSDRDHLKKEKSVHDMLQYKSKVEYEISEAENAILTRMGPRENVMQARNYLKVYEMTE